MGKFTLFFVAIAFLMANLVIGQKTNIGLLTFKATSYQDYVEADLLTEKVKEVFVDSKRFFPIDRTAYAELNAIKEAEIQKNVDYINGQVVEQGRKNGARAIVGGKLNTLSYKQMTGGLYRCDLVFSISINDIETNELLATKTFSSLLPSIPGTTRTQAMTNAINFYNKGIENFIIDNVPFVAKIYKVEPMKKGAEIRIIAGVGEGVKKGDKFAIYEVSKVDIGGAIKTLKESVAEFQIKEVEGDFSKGQIKKNGERLVTKFKDESIELICESVK